MSLFRKKTEEPAGPTWVLLGNAAPLMADGTPADIGRTVTEVQMREGWNDHAEIGLAASTDNDPMLTLILRLLGPDGRDYAFGLLEIQSLWTGTHSHDPPEWVESNDPGFAAALADYWTSPDHECFVGRPEDW